MRELLQNTDCDCHCEETSEKTLKFVKEQSFDYCIINAPEDEGAGLAKALSSSDILVILLSGEEMFAEISEHVAEFGAVVLQKPISVKLLKNILVSARAFRNKIKIVRQEKERLESRIEDIKIINRAKLTLIQYLAMSEPQAHKYIEKEAMDGRVSKRVVAERILKTYEY